MIDFTIHIGYKSFGVIHYDFMGYEIYWMDNEWAMKCALSICKYNHLLDDNQIEIRWRSNDEAIHKETASLCKATVEQHEQRYAQTVPRQAISR